MNEMLPSSLVLFRCDLIDRVDLFDLIHYWIYLNSPRRCKYSGSVYVSRVVFL